jgi:tetratricopeptide (TPR) repeat protein
LTKRTDDLQAKLSKTDAELAAREAKIADLQFQESNLAASLSSPDAPTTISRIDAELAGRPSKERAYALVREGERAANRGHRDIAKTLYEAAIREDKTYAPPRIALGFMAVNRGDLAEAERQYLAAHEADPSDPYALTALVNLYMGEKRIADAQKYAAILRKMPKLPPAAEIALTPVPPE